MHREARVERLSRRTSHCRVESKQVFTYRQSMRQPSPGVFASGFAFCCSVPLVQTAKAVRGGTSAFRAQVPRPTRSQETNRRQFQDTAMK